LRLAEVDMVSGGGGSDGGRSRGVLMMRRDLPWSTRRSRRIERGTEACIAKGGMNRDKEEE
jgi:hypothetical protein